MIRIIIIVLFSGILTSPLYCQNNDFGIWYGINTEHSISKKIEIDLSGMIRTIENASEIEQAFLEGGIAYKFSKAFALSGSYRITNNLEDNSEYHIRHKFLADARYSLPLNDFTFSARLRFQLQTRTYFEDEEDKIPDYTGRLRIKIHYNIPKFPVNPYICAELFTPLFVDSEKLIGKERFTAGFEYKIVKNHSVETEYIFERDYLPKVSDIHIISISYNLKF